MGELPDHWEDTLLGHPSGLNAAEQFWSLQQIPQTPDKSVIAYAHRVAAFTRVVFFWAETHFLGIKQLTPENTLWLTKQPDISLPPLPFDFDFYITPGKIEVARLNEFGPVLELSSEEIKLTLLFDGQTGFKVATRNDFQKNN